MTARDETIERGAGTLRNKLWWLITGRVAATTLLFLLARTLFSRSPGPSDRSLLLLFLTVMGLSVLYVGALRLSRRWQLQTGLQLFVDALIVTWLVWVTGDVRSPFA